MAYFSDIIYNTHGLKSAPVANAKIICNNEECGALLFRGDGDPLPPSPSDPNAWMTVFQNYNKTAMIGDPRDFDIGGDPLIWAERTGILYTSNPYVIEGAVSGGETICTTDLRVANGGIVKYTTGRNYNYSVYINGKVVYNSVGDVCPILITFPYGFGLITLQRMYYNGFKTDYMFADKLISFTKYGDSKLDWVYNEIAGHEVFGISNVWSGYARYVNRVTLYSDSNTPTQTVSFNPENSNLPSLPGRETSGGPIVYAKKFAYIYQWDDGGPLGRDTAYSPRVSLHIGNYYYYWRPTIVDPYLRTKEYLLDVQNWWYNPVYRQSESVSNEVEYINPLVLYPKSTGAYIFSNWGISIQTNDSRYYVFRSYQDRSYHWEVSTGIREVSGGGVSYDVTDLLEIYVDKPYDVFNNLNSPISFYLVFGKTHVREPSSSSYPMYWDITELSCFILKCTLDSISNIYNMSSSNFTFETIDISNGFTLTHPLMPESYYVAPIPFFQKNHYRRYKQISYNASPQKIEDTYENPPQIGEKWGSLFGNIGLDTSGNYIKNKLGMSYNYKGGTQISPYGSKYTIFDGVSFAEWTGEYFSPYGDTYDLEPIFVDLDNIQRSLNR